MMLAALDTGSTFGGMGSSREAMISSLIEPSVLVSLFTLGLISRSTSLFSIMNATRGGDLPLAHPIYFMIFLALLMIIIAETSRIPVDAPSPHLELTMVPEARILEYSGRHLALMEYGAAVKQLTLMDAARQHSDSARPDHPADGGRRRRLVPDDLSRENRRRIRPDCNCGGGNRQIQAVWRFPISRPYPSCYRSSDSCNISFWEAVMSDFFNTLSVLILLSAFLLMTKKTHQGLHRNLSDSVPAHRLRGGNDGNQGIMEEGRFDALVVCLVIVLLKVVHIPRILDRAYTGAPDRLEKDFVLSIPLLILVCCGLVVFSYFSVSAIDSLSRNTMNMQVVNSISVILIGLFFMISRKMALGQIIGFLEIENGLFITAMFATEGMPLIVDMGIFIDLITAVLVMGVMVFRINEEFDSIDIQKLNNLKG
jgi:hydrogenase-4 component E